MGKRGPPPTPTALLKARGSWRAKTRTDEPEAGRGRPRMPTTLMPEAKRIWARIVPELESMGVLTTADGDSLARYCTTLARWRRAMKALATGETYETKTTEGHPAWKARPEVAIAKGLAVDLAKLEAQFGLTPSARASLNVTAIYTPGRKVPANPPADPPPGTTPPAPNVIQGKERFFGVKPA